MKYYGNIELIEGSILNLKLESLEDIPTFESAKSGTIFFIKDSKSLLLNTGDEYVTLQTDEVSNAPFVSTLGDIWINDNFGFNPVPFNDDFANVSGLTANDSLYTVLEQLDQAITSTTISNIGNIGNVTLDTLSVGDVLFFDGTQFINGSINDIPGDTLELNLEQLADASITDISNNDFIVYDETASEYVNKKIFFEYENLSASTSFAVTHDLNSRYCHVTVIDRNTNTEIVPTNVTYNTSNLLTVNVASAIPVTILVSGVST